VNCSGGKIQDWSGCRNLIVLCGFELI